MKAIVAVVLIVAVVCIAGCGNVYLQSDAMTACQTSAMDAYSASQRASAEANLPSWENAYLQENYKQWRSFVRSATKDANWGQTLAGE